MRLNGGQMIINRPFNRRRDDYQHIYLSHSLFKFGHNRAEFLHNVTEHQNHVFANSLANLA